MIDETRRTFLEKTIASALVINTTAKSAEDPTPIPQGDGTSVLDHVPATMHAAIAAGSYAPSDPAFDLSHAFAEALRIALSRPHGGRVVVPPGVYTMSMNLSQADSSDFERSIVVAGAGRGATVIRPPASGAVMCDMLGRNRTTLQNLTLRAGDAFAARTAIRLGRTRRAPNANNNKFLNLDIEGNFNGPAIASCAAESSLWFNCRIAPNNSGARRGLWTGSDPALANDVFGQEAVAGPNSDNRMIACEFYMPFAGAVPLTISRAGGWLFDATTFLTASSGQAGQGMAVLTDFDGGVFNGPIHLRDCHFEGLAQNTIVIHVSGSGRRYVYGLSITGGNAVVRADATMLDYAGRGAGEGLLLMGGDFLAPAVSSEESRPLEFALHCWAIEEGRVHWHTRGGGGRFDAPGFARNSFIDAGRVAIGQNLGSFLRSSALAIEAPKRPGGAIDIEARILQQEETIDQMLRAMRAAGIVT